MAEEQIGKYRILGELGKGSMGMVYRAEDPEIGRIVAVKTLRSVYLGADAAGQEALQRFRQEARSAGMLKHPNIVMIFETGRTDSGSPFIVMEYVEGDSLEICLGKPMEPLLALHLLGQIASAIDYAHGFHMVHRDIKPSNIIVDSNSVAHLLDFGVAKLNDTSLTPAGTVVGTPSYMAPEQIRGETLDGATDRFALAVVAYEMFVGSRPFPGTDFMTVVSNIIHTEPIPFSLSKTSAPAEFEPILRKGLSKDRSQRYPTCLEFVRALAKPFNITVDHSGVVGYRDGMALNDLRNPSKSSPAPIPSSSSVPADTKAETAATVMAKIPESIVKGTGAAKSVESTGITSTGSKDFVPKPSTGGGGRAALVSGLLVILIGVGAYGYTRPGWHFPRRGEDYWVEKQPDADDSPAVDVVHSGKSTTVAEIPTTAPTAVTKILESTPAKETPVGLAALTSPSIAGTPAPAATAECLLTEGCGTPAPAVQSDQYGALLTMLSDTSLPDNDLIAAIGHLNEPKYSDIPYDTIAPVLLKLVQHPNFKVRIAVLKVFTSSEKFRTREIFREIVDRLDDSEFLVRGFTVKFLASLNNEAGMRLLEARLPKETDPTVKKLIMETLQKGK